MGCTGILNCRIEAFTSACPISPATTSHNLDRPRCPDTRYMRQLGNTGEKFCHAYANHRHPHRFVHYLNNLENIAQQELGC